MWFRVDFLPMFLFFKFGAHYYLDCITAYEGFLNKKMNSQIWILNF